MITNQFVYSLEALPPLASAVIVISEQNLTQSSITALEGMKN